jgi:hypothetical protein
MGEAASSPNLALLRSVVSEHGPASVLFAVVSGAHLYGYATPDSDVDVRGAHVYPLERLIGLHPPRDTVMFAGEARGARIDMISHEVGKYLALLAGRNGHAIEQVLSPLLVCAGPQFERLRALTRATLCRPLYYHYRGYARGRWKELTAEEPRRVKSLLPVYRVLLTGLHLLETGEVEANLVRLAATYQLDYVTALVERRLRGDSPLLEREEIEWHAPRVSGLETRLERAYEQSSLPDKAAGLEEIDDLLVELRLGERLASKARGHL